MSDRISQLASETAERILRNAHDELTHRGAAELVQAAMDRVADEYDAVLRRVLSDANEDKDALVVEVERLRALLGEKI